jgi:hypothetical protein
MPKIIITYTLKPGVSREIYEQWTRTVDYPAMCGLTRESSFVTHRTTCRLVGEGAPSVDYIEVFDVPDLDGFVREDMPGPVVRTVMGEFLQFVEKPEFLVAEDVV